jgi:hypothetical protein
MTIGQLNSSTAVVAPPADLSALSAKGYTDPGSCRRARRAAAEAAGLPSDAFENVKQGGLWHFRLKASGTAAETPAPANADGLDIPAAFKIPQEQRDAAWVKNPPRTSARASATEPKDPKRAAAEAELRAQISAASKKPPKVAATKRTPKTARTRYDWDAAEAKARTGVLPTAPDMSAPTHKYYKPKLDEVLKLARANDLRGLQSYKVGDRNNGSPGMVKQYQRIAIIAVKAKAAL